MTAIIFAQRWARKFFVHFSNKAVKTISPSPTTPAAIPVVAIKMIGTFQAVMKINLIYFWLYQYIYFFNLLTQNNWYCETLCDIKVISFLCFIYSNKKNWFFWTIYIYYLSEIIILCTFKSPLIIFFWQFYKYLFFTLTRNKLFISVWRWKARLYQFIYILKTDIINHTMNLKYLY